VSHAVLRCHGRCFKQSARYLIAQKSPASDDGTLAPIFPLKLFVKLVPFLGCTKGGQLGTLTCAARLRHQGSLCITHSSNIQQCRLHIHSGWIPCRSTTLARARGRACQLWQADMTQAFLHWQLVEPM
jgi:hypothetical protein